MNWIKKIIANCKNYSKIKQLKAKRKADKEAYEIGVMKYLVTQYNLIQDKKSTLSKSQRNKVEKDIAVLIASGKLKVNI